MLLTAASLESVPKESVVADSDSDGQGRLAIVWTLGKLTGVTDDEHGTVFASENERFNNVRWVGENLLVWPVAGGTSLLASGNMTKGLPCSPRDVLVAEDFIYATYSENQFLTGTDDTDPAGDRITAFNKAGQRVFGVDALIGRKRNDPDFNEFTQGAVTPEGCLIFVADASPLIWTLDPWTRTLRTVLPEHPIEVADHVSAVVCQHGRAGLVRLETESVRVEWFNLTDGRLAYEDRIPLPDDFLSQPGDIRVRGVKTGALLWKHHSLVRIS